MKKKKWLNLLWLIAFVPLIVVLCYYLVNSSFLDASNKVAIIIGVISYLGTIVLGFVTYWQTQEAYRINEHQFRRKSITQIEFKEDVSIGKYRFSLDVIKDLHDNSCLEGIFCSTRQGNKIAADAKEIYYRFSFYFRVSNAALENIIVKEVHISKQLANQEDCFVKLYRLTDKDNVYITFNPKNQCYCLDVYINDPDENIERLTKKGMFILDLVLEIVSVHDMAQQYSIYFNFQKKLIDFKQQLPTAFGALAPISIENIMINKGEAEYVRRKTSNRKKSQKRNRKSDATTKKNS